MANTFNLYNDAALSSLFGGTLTHEFDAGGGDSDSDFVVYLGSNAADKTMQTKVDPGVTSIAISVTDLTPASGPETSDIKLASTNGGLAGATAGASLALGASILSNLQSGVAASNQVAIHIRIAATAMASGNYTHLMFDDNGTKEF